LPTLSKLFDYKMYQCDPSDIITRRIMVYLADQVLFNFRRLKIQGKAIL